MGSTGERNRDILRLNGPVSASQNKAPTEVSYLFTVTFTSFENKEIVRRTTLGAAGSLGLL